MKYFIIEESLNEEVVGKDYPQACKFIKGYNPNAPKALFSLYQYHTRFPNYIPDLDGIMLSGSAKLTDFVSSGFSWRFFLISEKTKSIFEQHQLCTHRFYPLGLYKRKVKYNYFLFSIISDYSSNVDYEKSIFVEHDLLTGEKGDFVLLDSRKKLLQKNNRLQNKKGIQWAIQSEKIVMNENFNKELDFFNITRLDSATYVSERLKNSIESNGLTGWEFIPADNLIVDD